MKWYSDTTSRPCLSFFQSVQHRHCTAVAVQNCVYLIKYICIQQRRMRYYASSCFESTILHLNQKNRQVHELSLRRLGPWNQGVHNKALHFLAVFYWYSYTTAINKRYIPRKSLQFEIFQWFRKSYPVFQTDKHYEQNLHTCEKSWVLLSINCQRDGGNKTHVIWHLHTSERFTHAF